MENEMKGLKEQVVLMLSLKMSQSKDVKEYLYQLEEGKSSAALHIQSKYISTQATYISHIVRDTNGIKLDEWL